PGWAAQEMAQGDAEAGTVRREWELERLRMAALERRAHVSARDLREGLGEALGEGGKAEPLRHLDGGREIRLHELAAVGMVVEVEDAQVEGGIQLVGTA